ncbi:MAG: VWA domain-containing protein [Ruegeria sp.]
MAPHQERASAVRVPFFASLAEAAGQTPAKGAVVRSSKAVQMICATLCWCLVIAGLARPEMLGEPIVIEKAARDLVLAVDISGSMDERDLTDEEGKPLQRLEAVKQVVNDFIVQRDGDRIALIVFGSHAYLQTPFTEDLPSAAEFMQQTEVGMAGPHTAIGDAIGLALRTFEASKIEQKLLVLLSDGADTNSQMSPITAAEIAASKGVSIYTIGVGDENGTGDDRLDLDALKKVSDRANGAFYFANDTKGLRAIYDEIDALNPRVTDATTFQPRKQIFHYLFIAGLCVVLLTLSGSILSRGWGTTNG